MTHYETLGLAPGADADEIKKAYRKLSMQHHPDRTAGGSDVEFKAIKAAYEVLSDPDRRAKYDATGDDSQPPTRRKTAEMAVPSLAADVIRELFQSPYVTITEVDVVDQMRSKVRVNIQQMLTEYAGIEAVKARLQKLHGRFKRADGTGENMIAGALAADLATIERNLAANLEQQLLMSEVLEVLTDYSFDFDAPATPDQSGWTTIIKYAG